MKILQVHNHHRFGGGADMVALATVDLLGRAGHEVELFARDSRALAQRGWRGRWQAFEDAIRPGEAVKDFERYIAEFRPDIVHAHELYPLISPWIFPAAKRAGIAMILSLHDYRLTCPTNTHLRENRLCEECIDRGSVWPCVAHNCRGRWMESVAYASRSAVARRARLHDAVDAFAVPSNFTRDWHIRRGGMDPSRIFVVGNPVSPPPSLVSYEPKERQYIAFAGRISPEKGLSNLIAAVRRAKSPLRIAGSAQLDLTEQADNHVRFEGHLTGEAYERFLNGARMMAVPSLCYETFGLSAAEAMARGIPVVASRIGALAELIEDGTSGVLVEPGNVDAWAETLGRIWNDEDRLRTLSAGAMRRAAEFTPERYVSRLEEVYKRVLNRN